jgi:AhpD family alkylhydroperoxidase
MTGNAAGGAYIAMGDVVQQQAHILTFTATRCSLDAALTVVLCRGLIAQKARSMPAAQTGNFIATERRRMIMKFGMDLYQAAPEAIKALSALETLLQDNGLEQSLIELVKTRTSQINGCGVYTKRHAQDAREHGETGERLYALDAWREAPFYTDRERGALAWTEAVTLVSERYPRDDVYDEVRKHFSEAEIMNLTMLIATINVWNWLVVSYRAVPTNPLSRSINSCSFD